MVDYDEDDDEDDDDDDDDNGCAALSFRCNIEISYKQSYDTLHINSLPLSSS